MSIYIFVCRRKRDEYSDMEGGGSSSSKHRSRGSEAGSPSHNSRHAIPSGDRGRVPLPYPADHRDARLYADERWR